MFSHHNLQLFKFPKFLCFVFLSIWVCNAYAQKTTKYTYDALGRLTFVEDTQNGNRDYDYDAAGNRLSVAVSGLNDQVSEPGVPTIPTGLQSSHIADCAHRASWNASTSTSGSVHYVFRETDGTEINTTATTVYVDCPRGEPNSNKPKWVRACNNIGCSAQANF